MKLQEFIESNLDVLQMEDMISNVEAAKRANRVLTILAHLINYKYELMRDKIKSKSTRDAEYARAIGEAEGNNAPTREANAKADKGYISAREASELDDATVSTVDAYIKMMENCHIFYRGLGKDIDNGQ